MPFVVISAHIRGIEPATDRRSRMLLEPPQGRGFGLSLRFRTISLCPSQMIQGPGFKFGRDAFGHGGWEEWVPSSWVRPKDFAPAPWEALGRVQVVVRGRHEGYGVENKLH